MKPIDMQVLVKNVDHVAKINKTRDANIISQQTNSQHQMENKIEKSIHTINESSETEQQGIDKDGESNQEASSQNHNEREYNEEEHHKKKAKEPNKGRFIDLDI